MTRNRRRAKRIEKRRDFRMWVRIREFCAARGVQPNLHEAMKFLYRDDGFRYDRRLDMVIPRKLPRYYGSPLLDLLVR